MGHSWNLNLAWIAGVQEVIGSGVLPPRHLPLLWDGLGGNDFFFYGPLPYYLAVAVQVPCPDCSPQMVFAMSAGIGFVLAGCACYAFCRLFVGRLGAAFGGVCYVVLPYHLAIDWILRQAAAEAFAYIFVPIVALGFERMRRNQGGGTAFAIGIAGLGATHLPVGLLTAHLIFILLAAELWQRRRHSKPTLNFAGQTLAIGMLGGGLSAVFWLPALALLGDVSGDILYLPHFDATRWLVGAAEPAPDPEFLSLVLLAGLVSLIIAGAGAIAAIRARSSALFWLLGLTVPPVFLMIGLSWPFWEYWVLSRVQFPWRLMFPVDLAAALGLAMMVQALAGRQAAVRLGVGLTMLTLGTGALVLAASGLPKARAVDGPVDMRVGAIEYLPPDFSAELLRQMRARNQKFLPSGELVAEIAKNARLRSDAKSFTLGSRSAVAVAAQGQSKVLLPMPYWRHWRAWDGAGTQLLVGPDPELGMAIATHPKGWALANPVTLQLPWHWSEWAGAGISIGSWLTLILSLAMRRRNRPLPVSPVASTGRALATARSR